MERDTAAGSAAEPIDTGVLFDEREMSGTDSDAFESQVLCFSTLSRHVLAPGRK